MELRYFSEIPQDLRLHADGKGPFPGMRADTIVWDEGGVLIVVIKEWPNLKC